MNAQSNGAPASLPDFVPVIIIGAGPTGHHRCHDAGPVWDFHAGSRSA